MTNDEYLQSQIGPMLQPGEQVLQSAYMRRQPGLAMQILLVGGLLLFLITKAYLVVLTNRRLILIRTKMSFWSGGPKQLNLGVEEHDARNLAGCTTSGFANNRSMTFQLHQGTAMTLRISPWNKKIVGTAQFLEHVPGMITSGHLAQLSAGQPQMQQPQHQQPQHQQPQHQQPQHQQPQHQQPQHQQPQHQQPQHQQPQHQQHQQPQHQQPQHQQHQQPQHQQPQHQQPQYQQPQPHYQQPLGFQPGTRVLVVAQDGNRYPAMVAQAAQGQYLCTMPDGQSYWIPQQNVGMA